jgi:uncharacterized protein DUF4398
MRIRLSTLAAGTLAAGALAACSTPSRPAAAVSNAELAVHQADAKDAGEHAPLEIQLAREKLARAQKALHDDDHDKARRLADEALVDALLADAKADTQESRATAQALQQSIQSLQSETESSVQGVVR